MDIKDIKKMLSCEKELSEKKAIYNNINSDKNITEYLHLNKDSKNLQEKAKAILESINSLYENLKDIELDFDKLINKVDILCNKSEDNILDKDVEDLAHAEIKIAEIEINIIKLQKQIDENYKEFLKLSEEYKEIKSKIENNENIQNAIKKLKELKVIVDSIDKEYAETLESMSPEAKEIYTKTKNIFNKKGSSYMIVEWDISSDDARKNNRCKCNNLTEEEREKIMKELEKVNISSCSFCGRLIVNSK